jgi:hypothetical protein
MLGSKGLILVRSLNQQSIEGSHGDRCEVAVHQIRCLATAALNSRVGEFASAYAGKTCH